MKNIILMLMFGLVAMFAVPSVQAQTDDPNTPVVVTDNPAVETGKVTFIGTENLADSLKAIIDVVNDPQIVEVLNQAVETIKNTPDSKNPNDWFNYITAIVAALSALITLLLAKGKAIFGKLFKSS